MKNFAGIYCFLAFTITAQGQDIPAEPASEIQEVLAKVANWQIDEYEAGRIIKLPLTEWENGAFYTGMVAFKQVNANPRYDRFCTALANNADGTQAQSACLLMTIASHSYIRQLACIIV